MGGAPVCDSAGDTERETVREFERERRDSPAADEEARAEGMVDFAVPACIDLVRFGNVVART